MLKEAGVNLLAFSGCPYGRQSQRDFVHLDPQGFVNTARKDGMKLSSKKVGFLIQGHDRVGAIGETLSKL